MNSAPSNHDNNYSYFTIGQPAKEPGQKEKLTLQPALSNAVAKQESGKEYNIANNSTKTIISHKQITETVTKSYPKTESSTTKSVASDYDAEEVRNSKGEEKTEEETTSYHEDEDDEEHFNPPPEFFRTESRYENIRNPFADPDFDFDKFLDRLRGPTPKPKVIPKSQPGATLVVEKEINPNNPTAVVATRVPVPFTNGNGKNAPELNIAPVQYYATNINPIPNVPSNNINRALLQPLQALQALQPLQTLQPLSPLQPQRQPLPQLQQLPQLKQLQQPPPLKQLSPIPPRNVQLVKPLQSGQQLKSVQSVPQLKPLPSVQHSKSLQSIQPVNEYYERNTPKSPLYVNSDTNINARVRQASSVKDFVRTIPEAKVQPINKYYESNSAKTHVPHDLVKTSSIQSRPIVNMYYEQSTSKPVTQSYREPSTTRPPPPSSIKPQIIIERYEKSTKAPRKEYYYEYEDVTPPPKKLYSSQIKTTIKKENKVTLKKPSDDYDDYYYDDDEDEYPEEQNNQSYSDKNNFDSKHSQPNSLSKNNASSGEVKYSAKYQEKPPQIEKNPSLITTPRPASTTKNVDSYNAPSIYANFLPTTTPQSFNTARQRKRPSTTTTTTTISPRGKSKQRQPTRYDLDIKREQISKR